MLGIGAAIYLLTRGSASASEGLGKVFSDAKDAVTKTPFVPVAPSLPARAALTYAQALELVTWLDSSEFGSWFARDGRRRTDVVAVFKIESAYKPDAIGDLHLPDKSWGLGQVRGTTAADRGVADPRALLDPTTGALISMAQLKWSWDFLASRLGRAPSIDEWISSYNAGVGNVLNRGIINPTYVTKWRLAAGR